MHIPKKISEKIITQNPYLKISEKIFQEPNGKESHFLITSHNKTTSDATFVLPITENGKILYLKEYRY